jgi:hypothetical protein
VSAVLRLHTLEHIGALLMLSVQVLLWQGAGAALPDAGPVAAPCGCCSLCSPCAAAAGRHPPGDDGAQLQRSVCACFCPQVSISSIELECLCHAMLIGCQPVSN